MNKLLSILIFAIAFSICANGQVNKIAANAFLITRMVDKFHVQPKQLDDSLSAYIFSEVLSQLDGDRIFFSRQDIADLQPYRLQIDDEIKNKRSAFLQKITSLYQQRIVQTDSMVTVICKVPFNFNVAEKLTVAEDTSYTATLTDLKLKLSKRLKATALNGLLSASENISSFAPAQLKKYTDSLEPVLRKKIQATFHRTVVSMQQGTGGITEEVGTIYCKAIATCYDPHTAYLPPAEKENFESEVGKKPLKFGFALDEDDDGEVIVEDLKPGSPAYQSGQMNKGDKIISIQWEGKEPVDVSAAGIREISNMLEASNHDKIILTVKKADKTTRQVTLRKEKAQTDEDEDKVKSFILKGAKSIGYISLPAFYTDWEDASGANVNGCANDVAKEIIKLKKDNIDGLIIDVRYNGGGSMQEAVELSGIFIDAGPVAQIKTRDAKVITLKDVNRGTIYDGPLLLLVNGYSASASEMLAGTLQDYNRAVIVGTPTYGKATSQIILPMDTTIDLDKDVSNKPSDSYIKLTTGKLYRINGSTAQSKGVQPDVILPDVLEADPQREENNSYVISSPVIDANKYYKPNPALPSGWLKDVAKMYVDTSAYFKKVIDYVKREKLQQQKKDISLRLTDALAERKRLELSIVPEPTVNATGKYTVENNAFDKLQLKTNSSLKELSAAWQQILLGDPYVSIAFELLSFLPK